MYIRLTIFFIFHCLFELILLSYQVNYYVLYINNNNNNNNNNESVLYINNQLFYRI